MDRKMAWKASKNLTLPFSIMYIIFEMYSTNITLSARALATAPTPAAILHQVPENATPSPHSRNLGQRSIYKVPNIEAAPKKWLG